MGAIGTMVIAAPLWSVQMYKDNINATTRWVFGLVDEVAYSPKVIGDPDALGSPFADAQDESGAPPTDRNTGGQNDWNNKVNPLQGVSALMWRTYVHDPWARLQISNTNAGADENGRGGIADELAPDLLRIREPDGRAQYLCDISGKDCDGWFGDSNGGSEPEDTGATTGETTSEGGSTR